MYPKNKAMIRFSIVFVFLVAFGWFALGSTQRESHVRSFDFEYVAPVPALPAGAQQLRVWIPLPPSDGFQEISRLRIESPVAYQIRREAEYGNRYAYLKVDPRRVKTPFELRLHFQVKRREHRVDLAQASAADPPRPELARFLEPDRLVPINGIIAELAEQQTQGLQKPIEKARAVYDYVVSTMRYEKTGEGWGRGDAIYACTVRKGNCTDFHSLFIGMMRAAGIPARFEIGFPLPLDRHSGPIPGYHCWAQFYIEGVGWVPVDASEAWKNPPQRDYFFGAHDENRVLFTLGRDIRLNPAQQGDPLNYFIYPYAELDGKPLTLQSSFSFRDGQPAAP